jgi:hypothetical protein
VVLSLPLRHKDATQSRPYPLSSILPSILDSAIDSTPTSNREVEHHDAFEVRVGFRRGRASLLRPNHESYLTYPHEVPPRIAGPG